MIGIEALSTACGVDPSLILVPAKDRLRSDRRDTPAARRITNASLSVGFVLIPGYSLVDFSAFVDTLQQAANASRSKATPLCSWVVLAEDLQPIRSGSGVAVIPDRGFCDPRAFDYVVVVGSGSTDGPISAPLQQYLRDAVVSGVRIVEVSAGSFLLARLGLMQGKRCAVSWSHRKEFQAQFAGTKVRSDQKYVVDGNILTCSGGSSVVHLAAHLLREHGGVALAQKTIWTLPDPQSETPEHAQNLLMPRTRNRHIRRAILVMEGNMATPVTPEFVAKHVGVGLRQLQRLFMRELGISPATFSLRLRMDFALSRLLHSSLSVSNIALQSGFINQSHFSKAFKAHFGLSPTAMRELEERIS